MKKTLVAVAVITIFTQSSYGQKGINTAKVNLSSFAFKGFGLQYERKISKKFTVALGYNNIPQGTIAFQSYIRNLVDNPNVEVGNFQLGTSIFTPEVRFYTGKKGAGRGFYLAPYARISTYKMQVPVAFNSGSGKRSALFDGKLNNTTGGLMIGSQFRLSNMLYLDWWIIGGSIGTAKGNMVAITQLNPTEQIELKRQLDQVNIPFTTIESTVNSNGATVTTIGSMAGVRGLGVNLGIRF